MKRPTRRSLQTVLLTALFLLGMISPAVAAEGPQDGPPPEAASAESAGGESAGASGVDRAPDEAKDSQADDSQSDNGIEPEKHEHSDTGSDEDSCDEGDREPEGDEDSEDSRNESDSEDHRSSAVTNAQAKKADGSADDETETVRVDWTGNGDENLPCTGDTHWILTPGGDGDITDATLDVDGVSYQPADTGSRAVHFYTGSLEDVDEAFATFTGDPDGNHVLTISSCDGAEDNEDDDVEQGDDAYVDNPELKLVPMCAEDGSFVWDVINETGEAVDYKVEVYGHGIVHGGLTAAEGRTSEAFTTDIDGQTILLTEDSEGEWSQAGGSATKQPNRTECEGDNVEQGDEGPVELGESGTDQSDSCPGDYFKIENAESDLLEGEHTYTGTTKDGMAWTATLDVTLDEHDEIDTITIVSATYDSVFYKTGDGTFEADGATLDGDKAISNVTFCIGADEGDNEPTGDQPTGDQQDDESIQEPETGPGEAGPDAPESGQSAPAVDAPADQRDARFDLPAAEDALVLDEALTSDEESAVAPAAVDAELFGAPAAEDEPHAVLAAGEVAGAPVGGDGLAATGITGTSLMVLAGLLLLAGAGTVRMERRFRLE